MDGTAQREFGTAQPVWAQHARNLDRAKARQSRDWTARPGEEESFGSKLPQGAKTGKLIGAFAVVAQEARAMAIEDLIAQGIALRPICRRAGGHYFVLFCSSGKQLHECVRERERQKDGRY